MLFSFDYPDVWPWWLASLVEGQFSIWKRL
jgi:hypothetical protein